jgi:hypothetical protein
LPECWRFAGRSFVAIALPFPSWNCTQSPSQRTYQFSNARETRTPPLDGSETSAWTAYPPYVPAVVSVYFGGASPGAERPVCETDVTPSRRCQTVPV